MLGWSAWWGLSKPVSVCLHSLLLKTSEEFQVSLQVSHTFFQFLSFKSVCAFNPPSTNTLMTINTVRWRAVSSIPGVTVCFFSVSSPPPYLRPSHLCTITQAHTCGHTHTHPMFHSNWDLWARVPTPHCPHPFTPRGEWWVKVQPQWLTYSTTLLKCT